MVEAHSALESACPVCSSRKIQSMNFQGIVEPIVLRLMRIYAFWCNDCFRHFYLFLPKPKSSRR
jgi:hypothetical protein